MNRFVIHFRVIASNAHSIYEQWPQIRQTKRKNSIFFIVSISQYITFDWNVWILRFYRVTRFVVHISFFLSLFEWLWWCFFSSFRCCSFLSVIRWMQHNRMLKWLRPFKMVIFFNFYFKSLKLSIYYRLNRIKEKTTRISNKFFFCQRIQSERLFSLSLSINT